MLKFHEKESLSMSLLHIYWDTAVPNIGHAQGRPPLAGIKRNIKKHFHVEYARKNLNVNRSP